MKKTGSFVNGLLLVITVSLVMLGVVMVLSSSKFVFAQNEGNNNVYEYMGKQLIWFSLGLACLRFFAMTDYNLWERYSRFLMVITIALLAFVLTPFTPEINGAKRWIEISSFRIQPSEFAKLSIIMYLSAIWAGRPERLEMFFKGVIYPLLFVGVVLALILVEPDNGTTFFIVLLTMIIWFVAGGKLMHVIPVFTGLCAMILVAIYTHPVLYKRIMAFFNPEDHQSDKYYQVWQSLVGFGHGGVWGMGLGSGFGQTPYSYTDFIFSTMGEELGFMKCTIILLFFLMLVLLGYFIAYSCRNPFGTLLAVGCTTAIGAQAALNIAVVTGSIPTTGISLPFISYGGSSLIISMSMVGILMSIAKETFEHDLPRTNKRRRNIA